mgnify:CR=1 FL=1
MELKPLDFYILSLKLKIKEEMIYERYSNALKAMIIYFPVFLFTLIIFALVDNNILPEESYFAKILVFLSKGLLTFYISTILWYLLTPLKANIFLSENNINYNYVFAVIALRIALFFAVSQATSL